MMKTIFMASNGASSLATHHPVGRSAGTLASRPRELYHDSPRFDFSERLSFSQSPDITRAVIDILLREIPGATSVRPGTRAQDLAGGDFIVFRDGGQALYVDLKARERTFNGGQDLALETWSSIGDKPGWTRDAGKRTDCVLFYWHDTGDYLLLPFRPLRRAFIRHWRHWREVYQKAQQQSRGWVSESVFVPREVVLAAIAPEGGEA